jgi:hypothetical protein
MKVLHQLDILDNPRLSALNESLAQDASFFDRPITEKNPPDANVGWLYAKVVGSPPAVRDQLEAVMMSRLPADLPIDDLNTPVNASRQVNPTTNNPVIHVDLANRRFNQTRFGRNPATQVADGSGVEEALDCPNQLLSALFRELLYIAPPVVELEENGQLRILCKHPAVATRITRVVHRPIKPFARFLDEPVDTPISILSEIGCDKLMKDTARS